MPFFIAGREFQANRITAGLQFDSAFTSMPNIWYSVGTWTDTSNLDGDTSGSSIHIGLFNPPSFGLSALGDTRINTTTAGDQTQSAIAGLSTFKFVVTWTDNSQTGDDPSLGAIRAQMFEIGTGFVGSEFVVNSTTAGNQSESSVATLSSGNYVVTWTDSSQTGGDTSGDAMRGQVFAADGSRVGGEFLANTATAGAQHGSAVTGLAGGDFVVTWTDDGAGANPAVHGQIFTAAGVKSGGEFQVPAFSPSAQHDAKITALTDGGFVVSWTEDLGDASGQAVRAQTYTANGTAIGDELLVNTTTAGNQAGSSIAALDDGRFVVAWIDNSKATVAPVMVQVFGADGSKSGEEFQASTATTGAAADCSVASVGNGQFLVSWTGAAPSIPNSPFGGGVGDPSGIRAHYGNARQYSGTEGDDIVVGGSMADDFVGNGGNDTLHGLGGDDWLTGGFGNDILDGGAGSDTADYRFQLQAITVSLASGTASGADIDTDTLISIENVTGGDGSDQIDGDGHDNALTGGAGNDVFFAGAGHDTVLGGGDNDTLIGNDDPFAQEADILDGGAGNDTLYAEFTDTVTGGDGFDVLYAVNDFAWSIDLGATAIEYMRAGFGNDVVDGATQTLNLELYGGGGNDALTGGAANDFLWGESGNDTLVGGKGDDVLVGGDGADNMSAGDGNDVVYIDALDSAFDGGIGFDALYITAGSGRSIDMVATHFEIIVDLAGGNDVLNAANSNDPLTVYAGGGADIITGGTHTNFLWGEAGDDIISGGSGADTLVGGTGADVITGGDGIDTIYLNSGGGSDGALDRVVFAAGWGTDFVFDFVHGEDKIDLSALATDFASLTITNSSGHAYIQVGFAPDLIAVANNGGLLTENDFLFV